MFKKNESAASFNIWNVSGIPFIATWNSFSSREEAQNWIERSNKKGYGPYVVRPSSSGVEEGR